MNDLVKEEIRIVWSVLHNAEGYPVLKDNSILLGFDRKLCGQVRAKISLDDKDSYSPNSTEKNIILKAFEVFISEMSTESESIPLTDHNKTEIQKLYEKLKEMYKDPVV